jgi:two-component system, sporulation sensor kinase E
VRILWYNNHTLFEIQNQRHMRIFKSRLQKKLIFSFLIVAISPMVISVLVTTQIMYRRVEEDIKSTVYNACSIAEQEIEELQEKALQSSKNLLSQPENVEFARKAFSESQVWDEQSYIPIRDNAFLYKGIPPKTGKTILEVGIGQIKTLMAGAILPIEDDDGKVIGGLGAGYPLGPTFEQNITRLTGVAVRIFAKVSPGEEGEIKIYDVEFSPEAKEEIFQKHNKYYDRKATLKGKPYAALCKPFMGENDMLGLMLIGVPKTYAFQTVLRQYLPFLLGIWIVVAGALGYVITREITYPISKFIKGANAIASGNLNQHIKLASKDEIGNLASAFNNMAEELKKMQKMQEELRRLDRLSALGQLAAGVAHEVRNPLGIIKNSAQILESKPLTSARKKEIVNFIIEESERINRVIDNFLQFARTPKMKKEKTNINDVLDRTMRLVSDTLAKNDIEVIKDYTDSIPLIRADSSQLQQLFLNLILNSIEAMPKGGDLKISTQLENRKIRIVFSDTGCGISGRLKNKIFEPFYTTREHGTGLGLAIVHKIVENHEGKITLESKVGKGSTFNILLPIG